MTLQQDLRHQLARHGLRPNRKFGQNFLIDETTLTRIVEAVDVGPLIEIGAGPGTLTARLLERGEDVVAIEKDPRFVSLLGTRFGDALQVVQGDVLRLDLSTWGAGRNVVGNIPYLISSALLFRLIDQHVNLGSVVLMVQREVADRWLAGPGTKAYGIPSILLQVHAIPQRVVEVSRTAFWPAPKVESTVVRWSWRSTPTVAPESLNHFSRVVRAAFSQRRKKLRNALASTFSTPRIHEAARAVDLDRRAETLTIHEFDALARALT